MKREEAIEKARAAVEAEGWPWHESVSAELEERSYPEVGLLDSIRRVFGAARPPAEGRSVRQVWSVVSVLGNLPEAVFNPPSVLVVIDDETGAVLQKFYQPR